MAIVLAFGILLFWSIFWRLPCEWWTDLRNVTWSACARTPTGENPELRAIAFFIYLWIVYLAVTRF